tara:strand:- start:18167 stop:19156 length:990 start_codon:yes stop_codon:yes gene_type:complete
VTVEGTLKSYVNWVGYKSLAVQATSAAVVASNPPSRTLFTTGVLDGVLGPVVLETAVEDSMVGDGTSLAVEIISVDEIDVEVGDGSEDDDVSTKAEEDTTSDELLTTEDVSEEAEINEDVDWISEEILLEVGVICALLNELDELEELSAVEDAILELELDSMEEDGDGEDSKAELELELELRLAEDVVLLIISDDVMDESEDEISALEELLLDCSSEELLELVTEIVEDASESGVDDATRLELEVIREVEMVDETSAWLEDGGAVLVEEVGEDDDDDDDEAELDDEDTVETRDEEAELDNVATVVSVEDMEDESFASQSPNPGWHPVPQ